MSLRPVGVVVSVATCVFVLIAARVSAAPTCPYDERFRQLESNGGTHPALAAIGRSLERNRDADLTPEARAAGCRWIPLIRYVRTFTGLTNRCSMGVIGYTWQADACRSTPPTPASERFATIDFDARGRLRVTAASLRDTDPRARGSIMPAESGVASSCTPVASDNRDGARAAVTAVRDSAIRFDGCTFMGIDPEVVRGEVLDCMERVNTGLVAVELRPTGTAVGGPSCRVVTDVDRTETDQWVRIASGTSDAATFAWSVVRGAISRVLCASSGPLDPQGCARDQTPRRIAPAESCTLTTADRQAFTALGPFLCAEPGEVLSRRTIFSAPPNPPLEVDGQPIQVYATLGVLVSGAAGVGDVAVDDVVQHSIRRTRECIARPGSSIGAVTWTEILLSFAVGEMGIGAAYTSAAPQDREIASCLTRMLREESLRAPPGAGTALYQYTVRVRRR